MKVLKGIMCFILSAEWLGDDDAYAAERAADPLHRPGIDSKPFGDDPYTRPSRSRQGLTDSYQVTKGLAKTIRAMADGTLDSQVGARICNGLGIMRACLETQKLEQLEARMDDIADRVARDRTNAARERTSHP